MIRKITSVFGRETLIFLVFLASVARSGFGSSDVQEVVVPRLDQLGMREISPMTGLVSSSDAELRLAFDDAWFWVDVENLVEKEGTALALVFRVSECIEEKDIFVVRSDGDRALKRLRVVPPPTDRWQVEIRKSHDGWGVRIGIPFETFGIDPGYGEVIEASFILMNSPQRASELADSVADRPTSVRLYLGRKNLLQSPDLSDRSKWWFTEGDEELYRSSGKVIRIDTPGRYSIMQQQLNLQPHSFYRLEAESKGDSVIYLRARTAARQGEKTTPYTVWTRPSEDYRRNAVYFPTGEIGRALIIIGSTEESGHGTVFLRNLTVTREIRYESSGPRIRLAKDISRITIVKKIPATDCRALWGFIVAPIDGKLNSPRWDAGVWEYNQRGAGAGVGYAYRGNDGLHIRLADSMGVDAILIRGGAKAEIYADPDRVDDPGAAPKLASLDGIGEIERVNFPDRVASDHFAFFNVRDGVLADISFFRIEHADQADHPDSRSVKWSIGGTTEVPSEIDEALSRLFKRNERHALLMSPDASSPGVDVESGGVIHLISEPISSDLSLGAIVFDAQIDFPGSLGLLTLIVHDPLNPISELMRSDFVLQESGLARFEMDFPNQIIPKETRLWLTLSVPGGAHIERANIVLRQIPRAAALPEALEYRKLQMRGLFSALSEARPWTGLRRDPGIEAWLAQRGDYAPLLRELMRAIDQCKWLDAEDDLVRQYDEWFYRSYRNLPPFEPIIHAVQGAPEWAVVLRQAWLEARSVVKWWLNNRLAPTGEFGGEVGDDSDMYQNYVDFPFISDGALEHRLKEAASRLMDLADETTLEHGINRRSMDPLHAYEEGLNQEALMLLWEYGDPVAFERCLAATKALESLTIRTDRGHRHFRSQRLGAEDLRRESPIDIDGYAHPLMLHPAFEVVWYSGNDSALALLEEWGSGWLEHMRPGEYATSVEVATEKVVATTQRPIYGGYGALGSAMLFLHRLTGDAKFLEPFMEMWRTGRDNTSPHNLLPEMWHQGALDSLPQDAIDRLASARGIFRWLITGDKSPLIGDLKRDITEMQRFPAMYTTAEPFTDRVFLSAITKAAIAYTGGYATRNKFVHSHAVSWEGLGDDFAALVCVARPNRLKVLIYNFAARTLNGRMRVWSLEPGRYEMRRGVDTDGDDEPDEILGQDEIQLQRAGSVPLNLPPGRVTVIELEQTERSTPLHPRPDLAISRREIGWDGDFLIVPVHNIGSTDAPPSRIAVLDDAGDVLVESDVPAIRAPLDLMPKVEVIRLEVPGGSDRRIQIRVDYVEEITEIYEGNNSVELH